MAVDGSGIRIMSDSWMPFQPAIEEPSKPLPSSKNASSTTRVGTVTCCSLPLVSVKRRSTYLIPFSSISLRTSAPVVMCSPEFFAAMGLPRTARCDDPEACLWEGPKQCSNYASAQGWRKLHGEVRRTLQIEGDHCTVSVLTAFLVHNYGAGRRDLKRF